MVGELVNLVFRWAHILAAITAFGGTIFIRTVILPTLEQLTPMESEPLHAAFRSRWAKVVAVAIGFLLISGLYNVAVISIKYQLPRWYHPVFGLKFLAALVMFALASLLTGSSAAADELRKNAKFWLNVNIGLGILIVVLSGILRTADKVPKVRPAEAAAASAEQVAGNDWQFRHAWSNVNGWTSSPEVTLTPARMLSQSTAP